MSAANMNLNVQTLNQIGGALQTLNSDGTADQTGTQQLLASLQQQLGANFTQTAVSDHLDTSFTALGGFGASEIVGLAFAVVVSIITAGAASAAIGFGATAGSTFATSTAATAATATTSATVATTAGLGNIALSAAMAGFTSSIASQLTMTGSLNWGSAFEGAAVAGITAGLTNGITYNSTSGFDFTTTPLTVGGPTSSLASLAGANPLAGTSVSQASASTATTLETRALAMLGEAGISAGVGTAIEGGSLGTAFKDALTQEAAAAGAFAIGDADLGLAGSTLAHAALGCAAGAGSGAGCASGAIGGAVSAGLNPLIDANGNIPPAALTAIETLVSGSVAGVLGLNVQGAVTAAQNETLNNWAAHIGFSGSVTLGGLTYAGGVGVAADGNGNFGWYTAFNQKNIPGVGFGGSGSIGVSAGSYPGAGTIMDLGGPFNTASFGAGLGPYGGFDVYQDPTKAPWNPTSYGGGFTFGLGLGGGGSVTRPSTTVHPIGSVKN